MPSVANKATTRLTAAPTQNVFRRITASSYRSLVKEITRRVCAHDTIKRAERKCFTLLGSLCALTHCGSETLLSAAETSFRHCSVFGCGKWVRKPAPAVRALRMVYE